MERTNDGCRLCLDPVAENYCSIESPDLKQKMIEVFSFTIEDKKGYSTNVCQTCLHTISEFYTYSQQVRANQESLSVKIESNVEPIKTEPFGFFENDLKISKVKEEEHMSLKCGNSSHEDEQYEPSSGESMDESLSEFSEESTTNQRRIAGKTSADRTAQVGLEQKPKKKRIKFTKETIEQQDQQIQEFFKMICDLCGELGESFHALLDHFQIVHGKRGYVMCCKKKLFNRRYLLEHMTFHNNPNAFQCEVCHKSYKNKEYLGAHLAKVHGQGVDRQYKCIHCQVSFAKKHKLEAHLQNHEKTQCPYCHKMLKGAASLKVHITNLHSDTDRRMICDTCGRVFLSKLFFERHVQEHLGIDPVKKYQCQICQSWLKGERGLQDHLQHSHYEKAQEFFCDICQRRVANYRALQKHKRRVHTEEKFACDFCDRKFKQAYALKEHRAIHTGEVLYTCEICNKTSKSRANRYAHIKKAHPIEWAEKRRMDAEARIPKT
ncbi:transcription factor grauzone-like isoform X2 [Topomyia yanbarensis]|uniref:transcription factor grauzone-like isoform X2 n=1 Tax=Topomyia yanbarensis TaxID=2498891 RepID=UPI00273AC428|nr:transcription factor grauzone-like isoform X2 [Topomyia yanbarensis]